MGERIAGRYEVETLLGRGGMGRVFRVRDVASGEQLALKRLDRQGKRDHLRFRREFHALAGLRHPGVVQVFEYGVDEQGPFYTMELLEGSDLYALGTPSIETVCHVLRDIAETLAFLHARRFVHRDLAPRNVRVTSSGRSKLIDFGLLATSGVTADRSGTPSYVAPEIVRGLPLDHRADLYALGALGYQLLVGHPPYAVRKIDELEATWTKVPPPPSASRPDVPAALDELVRALLSLDPLRRPRSAADVIDRLDAITGARPGTPGDVARSYLASAILAGRRRELVQLRGCVQSALEGRGDAVLLEAPPGTGKSRLLRELGLEAQLAGAVVVHVAADAGVREPYALLRALARSLLAHAPAEAEAGARARAAELVRILPDAREVPAGDPSEERLRLQAAVLAWVAEVCGQRPLAVLVDDAQRADEASAAVLPALAQAAQRLRLVLALALDSDEPPRAPEALEAVRRTGVRLALHGLEAQDVEELVRAVLGDVPELGRVARWVHENAGGNPLVAHELLGALVERGALRYWDGMWMLVEDLGHAAPPQVAARPWEARLASLSPAARAVAEALSIHDGALGLDMCLALAERPEDEVFAALDELIHRGVLIGAEGEYRLSHGALRDALLSTVDAERRRALHLRLGEALLHSTGIDRDGEAGWHLLRGGDIEHGADLLDAVGRRLFDAQSFKDCIPPLQATLEARERLGAPERVTLDLKVRLLFAGMLADRAVAARHVEDTVVALHAYAGLARAQAWGRVLPAGAALPLAMVVQGARRWTSRRARRGPGPIDALQGFVFSLPSAATFAVLLNDAEHLRRCLELLRPLLISESHIFNATYLYVENLLSFVLGHWDVLERNGARMEKLWETRGWRALPDLTRRLGEGSVRLQLALVAAIQQKPEEYERQLARIEALKVRALDGQVAITRAVFHRCRGEEERASECEARGEAFQVQLGSVWSVEINRPVMSAHCYALTHDALSLKRCLEELRRVVRDGSQIEFLLKQTQGEYHRVRGELHESQAALERALGLLRDEQGSSRESILAALAETAYAAGDAAGAARLSREALAVREGQTAVMVAVRARRLLALAEAELGKGAEAANQLAALRADIAPYRNPLLAGLVEEARARVARLAGDGAAYEQARAAMERAYASTRNPALLARARAMEHGAAA